MLGEEFAMTGSILKKQMLYAAKLDLSLELKRYSLAHNSGKDLDTFY